ncbi:MAG: PAS domain-containing protein [Pirellulales bacterium]|nr:PAS domain-containing protein [Pirellulales bacterium]
MSETTTNHESASGGEPACRAELRVLVLAPFGRDAVEICGILDEAGIEAESCGDVDQLCAEIKQGVAAVMLAEEALSDSSRSRLTVSLAGQPTWSDLPMLLIISTVRDKQQGWRTLQGLERIAQLTLLERPLSTVVLVSAVRTAIQSRLRQYQVRDELAARRRAEKALREAAKRFRIVADFTYDWESWRGPDGCFLYISPGCERITGYTREQFLEDTDLHLRIVHPEDRAKLEAHFQDEQTDGDLCEIEFRIIHRDGQERWISHACQPVVDENGHFMGCRSSNRDITENKRAENSLRRLSHFPKENPNPVLRIGADGACMYANEPAREWLGSLGYQAGRALPDVILQVVSEAHGQSRAVASEITNDAGTTFYISAVQPPGEKYVNLYGSDITDRKHAEEALQQSRQDLSRAQSVGQIGNWRLDVRHDILTWSDENHIIFGVPKGEPMSYETFLNTVHPGDLKFVDNKWKAALKGEPYDIEHRIVVNGETRWVREKAYMEFDKNGELEGGFGITQDITDRRRAEESLRQLNVTLEQQVAERTAIAERRALDLGRLAAELSEAEHRERKRLAKLLHDDLQQLLLAVRLRLPAIVESDPDRLPEHFQRLDQLVGECLATSRNLTHELSPPIIQHGTLPEIIEWLVEWFSEKHGMHVDMETLSEIPPVPEYLRVFFFQAVRELLMNVLKHSGKMLARVILSYKDANLTLQVEDNGDHFDSKAVETRLQHPEGFGLFHIRERLEALQGNLEIEATPQSGGCFRIIIPLDKQNESMHETAKYIISKKRQSVARNKYAEDNVIRLLVADDHTVVREGFVGLLNRQSDFRVVGEAADGEQAVQQAEALNPDVVIMDVDMPKVNGIEATRRIKRRQPDTIVIGLSLHDDESIARAMTEAGVDTYVSKHDPAKDLLDAIRRGCGRQF